MLHAYRNANITFLRSANLENIPRIVHGFSTRGGGDPDSAFERNGEPGDDGARFLSALGLTDWQRGVLRQVHSNSVHFVRSKDFANQVQEGDALCTELPGFALTIATADCVPVLVADSEGRIVAAAHAGWRGTFEGVAGRTVATLTADVGVDVEDLYVAIGPHIGVCCMEVGEEVVEAFADSDVFERRVEWEKPHLNLAEANRKQLVEVGVLPDHIQVAALCTRCRGDLFHSYRRDGEAAGRMLSVIGIAP